MFICLHKKIRILFQLHHTGIKTALLSAELKALMLDFNCTIQELKPGCTDLILLRLFNFNCTIQELKRVKTNLAKR